MKSSITHTTHTCVIKTHARFHPVSFATGQVMALKRQL